MTDTNRWMTLQQMYEQRMENFRKSGTKSAGTNDYLEGYIYVEMLDKFVRTGQLPELADGEDGDYMQHYLCEVMSDPFVVYNVFADEVRARIFYDSMLAFIKQIVKREKFRNTCAQGELQRMEQVANWSPIRKRDGWERLLTEIANEYQQFGFDESLYRSEFEREGGLDNNDKWLKMIEDWTKSYERKQRHQRHQDIEQIKHRNTSVMKQSLESIPQYLKDKEVEKEDFFQAWGLMGGQWNSLLFEQHLRIAKLQRKYPQLQLMANKMGRIADEQLNSRMPVSIGGKMKMQHATKSDILGVALSKDIKSMLPLEIAQCSDAELYDVFLYKYATQNLQTFHHKSEMLKPSKQVAPRPARLRGPMIVCVDRSGSMEGLPENLANSLMMRLLLMAEQQHRDLFLVSFSVEARPIDVKKNRATLLEFFRQRSLGSTSATQMLREVFALLDSGEYSSADVLWFSDFCIPLCGSEQRKSITQYRHKGTKFYGLKIGSAEGRGWEEYFDEIVEVSVLRD